MAGKQARSTKKVQPRHRARKARYTAADWEKLTKTGMAWELFPGGPSTFVGRVRRGPATERPLDERKPNNHEDRHEAKKLARAAEAKAEAERLAAEAEAEQLRLLEAEAKAEAEAEVEAINAETLDQLAEAADREAVTQ